VENYASIREGNIDILIGTQQLTKGLDLPKLATVGVLHADLSLHFPDYSSDERTFQLIAQVMGRVGRGHTAGTVILQTFQPNNPVLKLAAKEDWHGFRDLQLQERKTHHFPPYAYYLKILFREKTYDLALSKAQKCRMNLAHLPLHVDGPMPSFYAKRNGYHYAQLILRSKSRKHLLTAAQKVPKGALVDFDPIDLL
jgi:primosomal protein N' (replication factor Y)